MKKFNLEQLQKAHAVPADKLFPPHIEPPETCGGEVNGKDRERLIASEPPGFLPEELEGKRRYMARLMPHLKEPSLVRALEVMLADDGHVLSYCQPFQASQKPPRRPRLGRCQTGKDLCSEPKWRAELAALAVGEAMSLAESVPDPLDSEAPLTTTCQLTVLSTWLWQQVALNQHLGPHPDPQRSFDEFDQSDPFEDDGVTKLIGDDGEPVKVRQRPVQFGAPSAPRLNELNRSHLLVMLRDLALHEPLYARVLALAWDIPLEQVGLEPDQVSCKEERLLLAHVICWSRSANLSVLGRHTRGRRQGSHRLNRHRPGSPG